MYYVYILKSKKDNGFYIGFSTNVNNRVLEHNKGNVKSTKSRTPLKLLHYSAFQNQKLATDFEKYLKSGSGKAFINKHFI